MIAVTLTSSEAWPIVQDAILAFRAKVPDMAKARRALAEVMVTQAWRSYDSPIGSRCDYDDFEAWVVARVPRGLETTAQNLWEIAKGDEKLSALVQPLLLSKIPAAIANGGDRRSEGFQSRDTRLKEDTRERVVARLQRDDPDLAERVIRGEISPNAAARQKGWRKPRIVVSSPERTAESIRKHMEPDARRALARLLLEGD